MYNININNIKGNGTLKKIIGAIFCFILINLMVINTFTDEKIDEHSVSQLMEELDISESKLVNSDRSLLNVLEVNNGDGTNTVYIFDEDIRYIDENGKVIDKDLSIVNSSDEEKIKDGYIATVKSNDINTDYPFSLKNKGIIMDNVQLMPLNSNAVLTESNSESVSYDNVYDGVDLICKPQLKGFMGKFELKSLSDFEKLKFKVASEFPYEISCEEGNIYIKVSESEEYKLTGASILGEKEEVIGSSYFVLENNDTISMEYSLAEEVNQTEVVTASLLMENISVENNSINQVTVFSESISEIEDGYNYVGTKEDDIIARTYIKFDLSALESIKYDKVLSACYNNYLYEYGNQDAIEVYFVRENCDYGNLEWSDLPRTGKEIFEQTTSTHEMEVDTTGKRSYYITSAVQAWLQGMDNNGIMIKTRNDEGWCKMSSNESSYTYLSVTYSEYEDTPTTKGVKRSNEPIYIINKNSKKALHTTETTSSGDIMQKSFDMSDNQKWVFVYNSSSYGRDLYKIKLYNSNVYLQIDPNQTHETCVSLSTNSSSDNLLWYIVRNWDGSYKILPKSLYLEESLAVHDSSTLDNANICLETTTVDFAQDDDWTFVPVNRDRATLYGLRRHGGLLTSVEIKKAAEKFYLSDYMYDMYIDEPANSVLEDLFDSQIWYFSSHGNNSRMYCYSEGESGTTDNTAIGLIDGMELDGGR